MQHFKQEKFGRWLNIKLWCQLMWCVCLRLSVCTHLLYLYTRILHSPQMAKHNIHIRLRVANPLCLCASDNIQCILRKAGQETAVFEHNKIMLFASIIQLCEVYNYSFVFRSRSRSPADRRYNRSPSPQYRYIVSSLCLIFFCLLSWWLFLKIM